MPLKGELKRQKPLRVVYYTNKQNQLLYTLLWSEYMTKITLGTCLSITATQSYVLKVYGAISSSRACSGSPLIWGLSIVHTMRCTAYTCSLHGLPGMTLTIRFLLMEEKETPRSKEPTSYPQQGQIFPLYLTASVLHSHPILSQQAT